MELLGLPDQSHLPYNQREYIKHFAGYIFTESQFADLIQSMGSMDDPVAVIKRAKEMGIGVKIKNNFVDC